MRWLSQAAWVCGCLEVSDWQHIGMPSQPLQPTPALLLPCRWGPLEVAAHD